MPKQFLWVATGILAGLLLGIVAPNVIKSRNQAPHQVTTTDAAAWSACYLEKDQESSPLFELDGKAYSTADLPLDMQFRLSNMLGEEFRRQQQFLENAGLRLYIAKEKGIDTKGAVPDLATILPDDLKVTDQEVKSFFEANKQSFPPKVSYETIKPSIEGHIRREKEQRMITAYRQKLVAENKIKWTLQPQCPPPMTIDLKSFPQVGSGGKVDLTIVSGFFCRACRETWPLIDETITAVPDKISWRPFFLIRPNSQADVYLTKGLYCASKQSQAHLAAFVRAGHQIPIQYDNDLKGLSDHIMTKILPEIKIETEDFTKCLESEEAVTYANTTASIIQNASLPNRPFYVVNQRLFLSDSDSEIEIAKAVQTLIR